ncbi:hypothetical protein GMORB2_7583, partial [Geosmithia morbida]
IMLLAQLLPLLGLASAGAATTPSSSSSSPVQPIQPDHDAAKANAHHIFNAVHSAGRQWGSSLRHNGFGLYPAVMPKGTVTYHGTHQPDAPTNPEWLAFEVEHAQGFGGTYRGRRRRGRLPPGGGPPGREHHPHGPPPPPEEPHSRRDSQKPLSPPHGDDDDDDGRHHRGPGKEGGGSGPDDDSDEPLHQGYLHMYRANRDLKLIYLDGMSAGKTDMGTLDTQDALLLGRAGGPVMNERQRADDICELIHPWGYDGFARLEVGFEIVYCDFSDGLDLVSVTRSHEQRDQLGPGSMGAFQWVRAVAERYDGVGGRMRIDFSSTVSGYFFPVNTSSTTPGRPDLGRLGAATPRELRDIRDYFAGVARAPRRFHVDWQGVVDLIVARFAHSFSFMASDAVTVAQFKDELDRATLVYVDAPAAPGPDDEGGRETERAIVRCVEHYTVPESVRADGWSLEDDLIHTAVTSTMEDICLGLFDMRASFTNAAAAQAATADEDGFRWDADLEGFETGRDLLRSLMGRLDWTEWARKARCPEGEVEFVAMWPFGQENDHFNPGCRSIEHLDEGGHRGGNKDSGYWKRERR